MFGNVRFGAPASGSSVVSTPPDVSDGASATVRAEAEGSAGSSQVYGLAEAIASGGILQVYVGTSSSVAGPEYDSEISSLSIGNVQASARASYTESLLFENVGPIGTRFHVEGFWKLRGTTGSGGSSGTPLINTVEAAGAGVAYVTVSGDHIEPSSLNDAILASDSTSTRNGELLGSHQHQDPDNLINMAFEGVAGSRVSFTVSLFALAQSNSSSTDVYNHAGASAFGIADFSHTMAWGGITSVTDDSNGEPIIGWSVTSDSGFDYSKPAVETPEPSSLVLVGLGGMSLAVIARNRARRMH